MSRPYRADQVGSFLRPPDLLEARRAGQDPDALRALEDRHIKRVLAVQEELGFDVFTDGELRRRNFMSDFTDAVAGFDLGDEMARTWQAGKAKDAPVSSVAGIVTAKLRKLRSLTGHELPFLKAHARGAIKMTLPSATQFPAIAYKAGITDRVYKDHSELLSDIVDIMKTELADLAAGGVACLAAARASGVTLAMHLCRGNNRSHWYAEGGYDAIAEKLFATMAVDRFLLEYDDERSGTFEPLRFIPRDKQVVLGLVSSKRPELETIDDVCRRVEEASRYVPMDNLALSPQCGFASTMEGNLLTEEEQWRKLGLVVEASRRLWS